MQNRCHLFAGRGRGHVRRQDVDGGDLSPASAQRDLRHAEAQQHHPRRLHRKKLRQGCGEFFLNADLEIRIGNQWTLIT